jgi:hypothetical protein
VKPYYTGRFAAESARNMPVSFICRYDPDVGVDLHQSGDEMLHAFLLVDADEDVSDRNQVVDRTFSVSYGHPALRLLDGVF